jgi:FAD/FMN-containing dehydrogenase
VAAEGERGGQAIARPAAEIATMRALKAALDRQCIVNPGKIFDVQPA